MQERCSMSVLAHFSLVLPGSVYGEKSAPNYDGESFASDADEEGHSVFFAHAARSDARVWA